MKFYITGTLSRQDDWVIKYIYSHGPISCLDEPAILDYADLFKKATFCVRRSGRTRCKPFEKKLINMWERGLLVRIKRPSVYADRDEVWHYGLPGRDPGDPLINTNKGAYDGD